MPTKLMTHSLALAVVNLQQLVQSWTNVFLPEGPDAATTNTNGLFGGVNQLMLLPNNDLHNQAWVYNRERVDMCPYIKSSMQLTLIKN